MRGIGIYLNLQHILFMSAQPENYRLKIICADTCDGGGKGTNTARFRKEFPTLYPDHVLISAREPGSFLPANEGDPPEVSAGEEIRKLLASAKPDVHPMGLFTTFMSFFVARADLYRRIEKMVKQDKERLFIAMLDRSLASTFAYQVIASQGGDFMRMAFEYAVTDLFNSLWQQVPGAEVHHLLIDVTDEEAARRREKRGEEDGALLQFGAPGFQERVMEGYRTFHESVTANMFQHSNIPHTSILLDGNGTPDEVYARFRDAAISIIGTPA